MKCRKIVPFFHNNLEFIWMSNETTVHLNGIEDAEHFHQWTIYILRLFHQIKWRCQQFSKFLSSRRHVSKEAQMRNAATWTNGAPNSTQSKQKSNRTMLKRNINCVCVCVCFSQVFRFITLPFYSSHNRCHVMINIYEAMKACSIYFTISQRLW